MHASHSSKVSANSPTANCCANVTQCCGPSWLPCPSSFAGEPIVKRPAGTTIISGQFVHSLKTSLGFKDRARSGDSGAFAGCVVGVGAGVAGVGPGDVGVGP